MTVTWKFTWAFLLSVTFIPTTSFAEGGKIESISPEKLAYDVTPEGVAFAPLMGKRFTEAYMAMVRLPAGLESPVHTKSANMFGVVISGEMTHSPPGTPTDAEIILPAGSFYKIPQDLPHVSKCVSTVECVTFLYQDGKFDFRPVKN
ncbi:MAG: DUF4437 domain-containing protein [Gammaproteobacteria bacterium]|nr:DUF4437 domain-containing protein [Gammaproteobacteria bacterium]